MSATRKPYDSPLDDARFFMRWAALMLLVWLGATLEHFGLADLGVLIWFALGAIVVALGFMLFYWGTRSATRRAAKDEEADR